MNLLDFYEGCRVVDNYPNERKSIAYLYLGMIAECEELARAVNLNDRRLELGDFLWYYTTLLFTCCATPEAHTELWAGVSPNTRSPHDSHGMSGALARTLQSMLQAEAWRAQKAERDGTVARVNELLTFLTSYKLRSILMELLHEQRAELDVIADLLFVKLMKRKREKLGCLGKCVNAPEGLPPHHTTFDMVCEVCAAKEVRKA